MLLVSFFITYQYHVVGRRKNDVELGPHPLANATLSVFHHRRGEFPAILMHEKIPEDV